MAWPGGFDALLAHLPALRRYARLLTGDRSRAEDLVHDTLERAHGKATLWRDGSLRAWLFTVMHNLHLNQARDARREVPGDGASPEPAHDPTTQWNQRLDIEQALATLSADARAVLLLVVVEEYSYAETAQILGVPVGTVMSRLHRAREALRLGMAEPRDTPRLRVVK